MTMRTVIVVVVVDAAADAAAKAPRATLQKFLMEALQMSQAMPLLKMLRKKNRRPRRRKSAESDTPEISDGSSENEPGNAVAEDSETEQRSPRRRRRRRSGVNDSHKDINENIDGAELKSEPASNNDVQEIPAMTSGGVVDKQVGPASEVEHSSSEISSDTPPETPAMQQEPESKPSGPPRTGWWRRLRS